jgi:hypothetical protein
MSGQIKSLVSLENAAETGYLVILTTPENRDYPLKQLLMHDLHKHMEISCKGGTACAQQADQFEGKRKQTLSNLTKDRF